MWWLDPGKEVLNVVSPNYLVVDYIVCANPCLT